MAHLLKKKKQKKNSFLRHYEILRIALEKYIGKFSYFIMKLYVECTH